MIKVLSFLSNEDCFAGHGLSTTDLCDVVFAAATDYAILFRRSSHKLFFQCQNLVFQKWKLL